MTDNYLYSRRLYKLQAKISGHAVPKVGYLYLCMFDSLGGRACTLPHPGSGLTGKKPRTRRPVKPFLGQATTISDSAKDCSHVAQKKNKE